MTMGWKGRERRGVICIHLDILKSTDLYLYYDERHTLSLYEPLEASLFGPLF